MKSRTHGLLFATLVCLALNLLTGCGGGSSNPSPSKQTPPTITMTATSGSGQSATVGAAFANPMAATVMSGGSPAANVTVTFTAPASEPNGTFAGGVATDTETTNSSGVATTSKAFTAGTKAGSYSISASTTGATTTASFSLSNTAGAAAGISAASGATQSTAVSTAFGTALQAMVVDSDSNPVSGVKVTFTAPATGASGTFATSGTTTETDTTGSNGVATASAFKANGTTGGPYTVSANFSGNTGAAAKFSLTNTTAPVPDIAVSSGSGQSAAVSTAFANKLVALVTTNGSPTSGVSVTFTAPSSGASGTFGNGTATETDITNSSGLATSSTFTANATVGGPYTVAATTSGAAASAKFSLTNSSGPNTYTFYMTGQEAPNASNKQTISYYALAGVVQIDSGGNVISGEQDYNDGYGITSPQPSGDSITGGTLVMENANGLGKLTLITNNPKLGVTGTETFTVQFANSKHALIMQFDGSATSSGSMDLQTAGKPAGNFAYTLSGVDSSYNQTAEGGVFTITGSNISGTSDDNDNGTVTSGHAWTGTLSAADSFGRGAIKVTGSSNLINYYLVGPEVIRIVQVNTTSAAVGSAFGQGTGSFSASSLGTSVLAMAGNPWSNNYATLAQFTTNHSSSFAGVGDDNEPGNGVHSAPAAPIAGTYTITSGGVGTMGITSANLGSVANLKIYLTDPALNLNDPNNPKGGGGALVLETDAILTGTTGVIVPQTDIATASFAGNYVVGAQSLNNYHAPNCTQCEFDMVAQGTVAGGLLEATGDVSDPLSTLVSGSGLYSGSAFSGTPPPDATNPGRYSPFALAATINGTKGSFEVVTYQASGEQLFWLDVDANGVWLGPLQQQGTLTGLP